MGGALGVIRKGTQSASTPHAGAVISVKAQRPPVCIFVFQKNIPKTDQQTHNTHATGGKLPASALHGNEAFVFQGKKSSERAAG